jgi:hypothetical protein
MEKPLKNIIKEYPRRGPMQQFRLNSAAAFDCFRCGQSKKSKLHTIYQNDWNHTLCNGCYGYLLSVHDIKAGTASDDEKTEALAKILLKLSEKKQTQEIVERIKIAEMRAKHLSPSSLKFIATSEYIHKNMPDEIHLDWSPAIIGLCKAVETELIIRLIDPLKEIVANRDISEDIKDKDFGRVARYCAVGNMKPPEIGAIRHFLQTAVHSKSRRGTSILVQALISVLSEWPKSNWIEDPVGAVEDLNKLTSQYRNRAAHIDELKREDYQACYTFTCGNDGIMWKLISATTPRS